MCPHELLLAVVLLFGCIAFAASSSANGWTDPSGMIIQLRGSDIRIRCGVHGDQYSSSELWFFNNSDRVDAQYVKVINASVIEMLIPDAEEQESVILCKMNGQHGISYNDIKIGRKPDNITALKCISHNWHDMNCSFEKPYNPVAVQYSMTYRIPGSSQIYPCIQPLVKDPKIFWCHIPNNFYRRANPTFEFSLNGINVLGSLSQTITIDNYASVIPSTPENFKEIKIMADGVILGWSVNSNLLVFPKPFDYEFKIESQCDPEAKRLRFTNLAAVDESDSPTNFTRAISLKFVHTWYKIDIRMKISTAPDDEYMWSEWAKINVKTVMRPPDHPPVVDNGSFNIGPGGDVYIYWKHLQKCYQNGINYSYVISSNNKQFEMPNEIHQQLAKYTKDRFNLMKDTILSIRNVNSMGTSKKASTLEIPGAMRRLEGPTKIKKFLTNGSYQLSWSAPNHIKEHITSYTVFWCVSKSELPNSCDSSIDFARRLPSETYFEYTSNETINFAVSANSKDSTSGMIWAKCTTASSKEIGKIKTIWIPRLAAEEIEVEWKLECTDSGIVAGYQLEYCPSKEPKTLECMEKEKKINITGGLESPKHTLTGLTPYTTYKIIIRMYSNSTMGPESDPLANTTLEAAPSEVRGLIARNVGNTSAELYWDPPEFSNGVLLFYKVWANGKDHKVSGLDHKLVEIDSAHVTRMNYTLGELIPFTEYDIAVEACTKECSNPTKTKIKTTIGAPGNLFQPSIKTYHNHLLKNYTSAAIGWDEPTLKGGELDYYEFKSTLTTVDDKMVENIVKTRNTRCYIEQLCTGNIMSYEFSVRAVNFVRTPHSKESKTTVKGSSERQNCERDDEVLIKSLDALKIADPHGWHLPGPWAQAVGHSCHYGGLNAKQNVIMLFMVIASLVIAVMVFYIYRKYKDMKDILVQMPPGLEDLPCDKMKKGKDVGNMETIPDILSNIDNVSINCEDENGQLLKKSLNGSLNEAECSSSLHSESTRSELENDDEIEYGEFGNDKVKHTDEGLQSFIINPATGKEVLSLISSPELVSTPVSEKCSKPNIILNPKTTMPSSGYVTQPPVRGNSPVAPINSNGYVTHSMFNPIQSSGYTPLSAFRKPIVSPSAAIEDKINPKTPIVATTDQEGISGYVTHKQLSDFGHRMQ